MKFIMNKKIMIGIFAALALASGIVAYATFSSGSLTTQNEQMEGQQDGLIVDEALPAPQFPPKASDENGITVTVTPLLVASDIATWKFDVVMSTHVVELGSYDLKEMATLTDGTGKVYRPISWEPDAKEGHHIGGVLQFDRPTTESDNVTVKITGVGGPGERVFEWRKQ